MSEEKLVTINGQRYDAHTGLPITQPKRAVISKKPTKPTPAATIHASTQRSKTLIRRLTKKPAIVPRPQTAGQTMDIARSSKIARFAPHPVAKTAPVTSSTPDIAARPHPITAKVYAQHAKNHVVAAPVEKTSRQIKEEAIEAALAKPLPKPPKKKSFFKRYPKFISITTVSIVVIILGAYLTYVNIPSLSVKVAAVQAGINATYPDYRPDGYSINGPVTFNEGEVTINFAANTGSSKFTITQKKSMLDSSAVLDNIVRKEAGEAYNTSQEGGLTIYTYKGNAAWVNAGILYTIKGDAPLSGEQIRRIATSL